jgi:Xaa-Pro aminopeptidase
MWLLNVRGNDLRYTPVTLCYSLILKERILLFTDQNKIPVALISEFKESGIEIQPYDLINDSLRNLEPGRAILVSPSSTSISLFGAINEGVRIIEDITIPSRLKAVKNRSEIRNLSEVMARDGAALEKLFFWLENRPADSNVTESSIEEKLLEFRKMQEDFICPSFRTVVAFNEHSAFPHYASSEESNSIIGERGILLIDSGGQYSGGTTDITRTISVGTPTIQQKRDFTLILKGHIALALAKFPSGTRGYQLDILARESLWKYGINFGHGTGHGVGYCLSVHEGPHSISPADIKYSIDAGMLMSNEPAIYRVGEYGIRTENLILCYEDEETEFGTFLKFDTVSLCHIDKHLIDSSILIEEEIKWINSYHLHVFERLSPLLTPAEVSWLKEKTSSL